MQTIEMTRIQVGPNLVPLDTSETEQVYLLECESGAKIRLPHYAADVLRMTWDSRTAAEIADVLKERHLIAATEDDVLKYQAKLLDRIAEHERAGTSADSAFATKWTLMSAKLVDAISRRLTFMYSRLAAFLSVPLIVVAFTTLYSAHPHFRPSWEAGGLGTVLFLLSAVVHELGHSTAARRFGISPGKIGATLYLVFPALYSDVTDVWSLRRTERVVVDLGGSYFQCICGAAYAGGFTLSGNSAFLYAAILVAITTAFNLAPVFKYDGYWVVSDALGVTNLSKQPRRILLFAQARIRGLETTPLPWSNATLACVAAYGVVATGAWAILVVRVTASIANGFGVIPNAVHQTVFQGGSLQAVLGLSVSLVFFAMTCYGALRLATKALRALGTQLESVLKQRR